MAYFKNNEHEDTRRTASLPDEAGSYPENRSWAEYNDDYDDGLDDLTDDGEYEEELTEEEKEDIRKNRVRIFFSAGNLVGIIAGSVAILLLLALLFSMVNFVLTDITRSFTLFQKNF